MLYCLKEIFQNHNTKKFKVSYFKFTESLKIFELFNELKKAELKVSQFRI